MISVLLDEGTRAKLQFLSADYVTTLLTLVPARHVPANLGGLLVDADQNHSCPGIVGPGGLVPLGFRVNMGAPDDGFGPGEEVDIAVRPVV
jgi:hypothetical protein